MTLISVILQSPIIVLKCAGPASDSRARSVAKQGALNKIRPEISEPEGTLPEQECWWKWLYCRLAWKQLKCCSHVLRWNKPTTQVALHRIIPHHLYGWERGIIPLYVNDPFESLDLWWRMWAGKKSCYFTRKEIKEVTQRLSEESKFLPLIVNTPHEKTKTNVVLVCVSVVSQ